ncbi:MAG: MGMT family protein [Hyphomicrobium sp.]|nr:MGMT family protein [Hyphomicrobium sp.]
MVRLANRSPLRADVLAIVMSVPSGRVTTLGTLAAALGVHERRIASILAGLDPSEFQTVPWHRVVQNGGAIGRHARRMDQVYRLREEGVTLSAAGIVQDLAGRLSPYRASAPGVARSAGPTPSEPPHSARRARGSKTAPKSTI